MKSLAIVAAAASLSMGLAAPVLSAPAEPAPIAPQPASPQPASPQATEPLRLLYSKWLNNSSGTATLLRSAKLDGSNIQTHLQAGAGYSLGTLSPDRTRLAWTTYEPDRVMVGTATGGGARKLLDGFAQVPAWSPDGTHAYTTTTDREWTEPARLWRIPTNGGAPVSIWQGDQVGDIVGVRGASPTHVLAEIIGSGEPELFTVPVDGGAAAEHPTWDAAVHAPGTEIVFALAPKKGAYRLIRHDMSTGASSVVHTFKNKNAWYPTWSADGSRFAISGSDKGGPFMLMTNRAGGAKKRVSPLPKSALAGYSRIGLSPDGNAMAYRVSSRYGSPYDGLYLRDNKRSRTCKVKVAASSPTAVFSPDGRWIVITEYDNAIVATKNVVSKGGKARKVKLGSNTEVVGFVGGSSKPAAIAPCGKG